LKDLEGQLARDERSAPQLLDNLKRMDAEWKAKYKSKQSELGQRIREAVQSKQLSQKTGNRILNLLEQGQVTLSPVSNNRNYAVEAVRRLPAVYVQPQTDKPSINFTIIITMF
jgi:hypothetical protein